MQARLEVELKENFESDSMKNPALEWKSNSRRGFKLVARRFKFAAQSSAAAATTGSMLIKRP